MSHCFHQPSTPANPKYCAPLGIKRLEGSWTTSGFTSALRPKITTAGTRLVMSQGAECHTKHIGGKLHLPHIGSADFGSFILILTNVVGKANREVLRSDIDLENVGILPTRVPCKTPSQAFLLPAEFFHACHSIPPKLRQKKMPLTLDFYPTELIDIHK